MRDWGNRFTGNTGFAIALALAARGFEVELLTSNPTHRDQVAKGITRLRTAAFTTHADLRRELDIRMSRDPVDAVFMTAAVADYRPSGAFQVVRRERNGDEEKWIVRKADTPKVKSTFDEIAFLGARTEKLIDLFRSTWKFRGFLVKFKLEVGLANDELLKVGNASRIASGADYLVANTLDMVSGAHAGAYLIGENGSTFVPREELAARLSRLAIDFNEMR